jgi:hypothetical protein
MPRLHLQFRFLMVAAAVVGVGGGHAVAETPEEIIAAKIRLHGFARDKPISAERDRAVSRPNEAVWLLKCEDHNYRVRLVPNMAADVSKTAAISERSARLRMCTREQFNSEEYGCSPRAHTTGSQPAMPRGASICRRRHRPLGL